MNKNTRTHLQLHDSTNHAQSIPRFNLLILHYLSFFHKVSFWFDIWRSEVSVKSRSNHLTSFRIFSNKIRKVSAFFDLRKQSETVFTRCLEKQVGRKRGQSVWVFYAEWLLHFQFDTWLVKVKRDEASPRNRYEEWPPKLFEEINCSNKSLTWSTVQTWSIAKYGSNRDWDKEILFRF